MRQTPHRLARRAMPSRFEPSAFIAVLPGVPGLALAMGLALVATVPAARGFSDSFGWMPLWLLGMPASACLVAYLQRARATVSSPEPGRAGASRARRAPAAMASRGRYARRAPGLSRAA